MTLPSRARPFDPRTLALLAAHARGATLPAGAGPHEVIVIDTETTACDQQRLVEIAGVRARDGVVLEEFEVFVHPGMKIPRFATSIHGITDAMVRQAPRTREALAAFAAFVGTTPLVAHNASFDRRVLAAEFAREGLAPPGVTVYCTLKLARRVLTDAPNHRLATLASFLQLPVVPVHRALADARAALGVLNACLARRPGQGLGALHGSTHTL